MRRVVIELTNRCNLACRHCFASRHGGSDDVPPVALEKVLREARPCGFEHISLTGGEPALHPQFGGIVERICQAGYRFGLVTNGWAFDEWQALFVTHSHQLSGITFSLDGATEATHNSLRGTGSFRRVMKAISLCVFHGLPFGINMAVTADNRHELGALAALAEKLGSHGVRFGHMTPSQRAARSELDLSPKQRKDVEAEIRELRLRHTMAIALAPGGYSRELFPCDPLTLNEVNIDCSGNMTKCCHLSGQCGTEPRDDVAGSLLEISFEAGLARLAEQNTEFQRRKRALHETGTLHDSDYFACWYCSLFFRKMEWLKTAPEHPWAPLLWEPAEKQ
jgi:MoaA/NifB/PqqE/SkfB family radical SAM enzyme